MRRGSHRRDADAPHPFRCVGALAPFRGAGLQYAAMEIALNVANEPPARKAEVGRYVVDFGHETVAGFTAREVAELLESEQFQRAKVFRIHNAYPDGRMEMVGVSNLRFHAEDCFLFYRHSMDTARSDFDALRDAALRQPPPCRARVQLTRWSDEPGRCVTALLYPAEYGDEMSAWLVRIGYQGGDTVEGGVSHAAGYAAMQDVIVLDRLQLWGTQDGRLAEQAHAKPAVEAAAS
jgi:hypothetical protein